MSRLRWCKVCFAKLPPEAGNRRRYCFKRECRRAAAAMSWARWAATARPALHEADRARYATNGDAKRAYQRAYYYRVSKPRSCGLPPEAA